MGGNKKKKKKSTGTRPSASVSASVGSDSDEMDIMDCATEQEMEVEALRAIFADDFQDGEIGSGQEGIITRAFSLIATPHPGQDDMNHVKVKVKFQYPAQYPQHAPILEVERIAGLTDKELAELNTLVKTFAQENRKEVQAMQIADQVQEFLVNHNRKPLSLYEEMMARRQEIVPSTEEDEDEDDTRDAVDKKEDLIRAIAKQVLETDEPLKTPQKTTPRSANLPPLPTGTIHTQDGHQQQAAHNAGGGLRPLGVQAREGPSLGPDPSSKYSFGDFGGVSYGGMDDPPSFGSVGHLLENIRQNSVTPSLTSSSTHEYDPQREELLIIHMLRQFCAQQQQVPFERAYRYFSDFFGKRLNMTRTPNLWKSPEAFEAAFSSVFKAERQPASIVDPVDKLLLSQFWSQDPTIERQAAQSASRYLSDFKELEILGAGSFGQVVKAKNNLDGRLYAIKKISLGSDSAVNKKVLREVTTLSRLHHQFIVRYYQAWIEWNSDEEEEGATTTSKHTSLTGTERSWMLGGSRSKSRSRSGQLMLTPGFGGNDFFSGLHSDSIFLHEESGDDETDPFEESTGASLEPNGAILYIQMEYCQETLRHVISRGLPEGSPEEQWRLFRQILEGLVHIHRQGTIHRDLKPSNIFFDSAGDIKIGDFGLATGAGETDHQRHTNTAEEPRFTGSAQQADDERTVGVGTYFYTAPEQEAEGESYDEKVDLYALGVIFFELMHPLTTAHERATTLTNLRQHLIFPEGFEDTRPQQVQIIRSLLQKDPAKRPSTLELLQSDLLPPKMEDEYLKEALRTIANPGSVFYFRLLDALFSFRQLETQEPSTSLGRHDSTEGMEDFMMKEAFQNRIHEALKAIFTRHGAIPMSLSTVMQEPPSKSEIASGKSASLLMNQEGGLFALRSDLRTTFAKFLNQSGVSSLKSFEIASVFRHAPGPTGSPYREIMQCDFDIAGHTPLVEEAECVKILTEIVTEFPQLGRTMIRVSHTGLIAPMMELCGIRKDMHRTVLKIVSQFDRQPWPQIRRQLLAADIAEKSVTKLSSFLHFPRDCHGFDRIGDMYERHEKAAKPLQELATFHKYLHWFDISDHVFIDVSLVPRQEWYSGIIFAASLRADGTTTVFAMGGRYDPLIDMMRDEASHHERTGAVGFTLATDILVEACHPPDRVVTKEIALGVETDVLVCSVGSDMLEVKMKAVSVLWANQIQAEFYGGEDPSVDEQFDYATSRGIFWAVIVKEHRTRDSTSTDVGGMGVQDRMFKFRVKSLQQSGKGGTDREMELNDIVTFLQPFLRAAPSGSSTRRSRSVQMD
eukprot:GFYU01015738.1.p1 GENE.GFYU01015738.1~~GFYU01015738.1.p1  ORF type:complete len:1304 (+),score=377.66 GFYU01015738.1:84-3995(+)